MGRKTVNIVREMEREWGIKSRGACRLLLDGQVLLDDRVLTMDDEKLPVDECRGRMLTAGHRQARLFGSQRYVPEPAQPTLPFV